MSVTLIAWWVLPLLVAAVVMCVVRLIQGPNIPDRVIAIDLMATLAIGVTAAYAIATNQTVLLDVATVLALISFLSSIAFAYYLEHHI